MLLFWQEIVDYLNDAKLATSVAFFSGPGLSAEPVSALSIGYIFWDIVQYQPDFLSVMV